MRYTACIVYLILLSVLVTLVYAGALPMRSVTLCTFSSDGQCTNLAWVVDNIYAGLVTVGLVCAVVESFLAPTGYVFISRWLTEWFANGSFASAITLLTGDRSLLSMMMTFGLTGLVAAIRLTTVRFNEGKQLAMVRRLIGGGFAVIMAKAAALLSNCLISSGTLGAWPLATVLCWFGTAPFVYCASLNAIGDGERLMRVHSYGNLASRCSAAVLLVLAVYA